MTSRYCSQFSAICMGLFYAGRPDLYHKDVKFEIPEHIPEENKPQSTRLRKAVERQNPQPKVKNEIPEGSEQIKTLEELLRLKEDEITLVEGEGVAQLGGNKLPDCKMVEFKNIVGKTIRVASCRFREDEWDCWLIDPDTGMGWRC